MGWLAAGWRPTPVPGVEKERVNVLDGDVLAGGIARLSSRDRDLPQIGALDPERGQRDGTFERGDEIVEGTGAVIWRGRAEGPGQGPGGDGRLRAQHMGQEDTVAGRVSGADPAAECVAQCVVQAHRRAGQAGAGQVRAVQRSGSCGARVRAVHAVPDATADAVPHNRRQSPGQGTQTALGHALDLRIDTRCVERLHGVGHGVDRALHRDVERQPEGELGVVDNQPWPGPSAAPGGLLSAVGDPVDTGHLRARVGRRDGRQRRAGVEGERLRQANGRASTHGQQPIGLAVADRRECGPNHCRGHVWNRCRDNTGTAIAQPASYLSDFVSDFVSDCLSDFVSDCLPAFLAGLPGRAPAGDDEHAAGAECCQLVADGQTSSRGKYDAGSAPLKREVNVPTCNSCYANRCRTQHVNWVTGPSVLGDNPIVMAGCSRLRRSSVVFC